MSEIITKEQIKEMNLWQRIYHVREIADVLVKDKAGYNYNYTSEEEILVKVRAGMSKYGVVIFPNIVHESVTLTPRHFHDRVYDKAKNAFVEGKEKVEYLISAWVNVKIVNVDNPEDYAVVPWYMTAVSDDPSSAYGSALTYANRYFFLKFLNISTSEDDPDAWRKRNQDAKFADEAAATAKVISMIDATSRQYLTEDKRNDFANMLKKLIVIDGKPSANFAAIKDLETATKVHDEVRKFFSLDAKEE